MPHATAGEREEGRGVVVWLKPRAVRPTGRRGELPLRGARP